MPLANDSLCQKHLVCFSSGNVFAHVLTVSFCFITFSILLFNSFLSLLTVGAAQYSYSRLFKPPAGRGIDTTLSSSPKRNHSVVASTSFTFPSSIRHPSDRSVNVVFSKTHLVDADVPTEDHYFYPMRTADGDRYMCLVPSDEAAVEAKLQGFHIAAKARHGKVVPPEMLELLPDSSASPCYQIQLGYWTYKLCIGEHVRRFHVDEKEIVSVLLGKAYGGAPPVTKEFREKAWEERSSHPAASTGKKMNFSNTNEKQSMRTAGRRVDMETSHVEGTRASFLTGKQRNKDRHSTGSKSTPRATEPTTTPSTAKSDHPIFREEGEEETWKEPSSGGENEGEGMLSRFGHDHLGAYISTMYWNGDYCEDAIHQEDRRMTEVRMYCSNGREGWFGVRTSPPFPDILMDVVEVGSCKYIVTLQIVTACRIPELKEPSVTRDVVCYPL